MFLGVFGLFFLLLYPSLQNEQKPSEESKTSVLVTPTMASAYPENPAEFLIDATAVQRLPAFSLLLSFCYQFFLIFRPEKRAFLIVTGVFLFFCVVVTLAAYGVGFLKESFSRIHIATWFSMFQRAENENHECEIPWNHFTLMLFSFVSTMFQISQIKSSTSVISFPHKQ